MSCGGAGGFPVRGQGRAGDGRSGCHGLEQRHAEALVQRGLDEGFRAREQRGLFLFAHASGEDSPLPQHRGSLNAAAQGATAAAGAVAGDDESQVWTLPGDTLPRVEEARDVLAWLGTPEAEDIGFLDPEAFQDPYRHWLRFSHNQLITAVLRKARPALLDLFLHAR